MNPKILRYTLFESKSNSHGGDKRTAQISELLENLSCSWERIPTGMETPKVSLNFFIKVLRNISLFIKVFFIIQRCFHPYRLYRTLKLINQFKGIFFSGGGKNSKILFWESTKSEYTFILPYFRKKGYKIIAFPHNLESLVPGQKSGITNRPSPNWFMEEIKIFKKCNAVFAISFEETLLLRQFGVNALYLPYYPENSSFNYLMKIRSARVKKKYNSGNRKQVLMLGSAINLPTIQGMIDRIDFFEKNKLKYFDLIIVGFGTEQLKNTASNSNIKIVGEVAEEELSKILINTDVLLVHQPPTSGALTRIIEMLIAGVPVIANFESARSYYNVEGVNVYMNNNQLLNLLKTNLKIPPVPPKPLKEIQFFNETILSI